MKIYKVRGRKERLIASILSNDKYSHSSDTYSEARKGLEKLSHDELISLNLVIDAQSRERELWDMPK